MENKVIPKIYIDKALDMERAYWEPDTTITADEVFAFHKRVEKECGVTGHLSAACARLSSPSAA